MIWIASEKFVNDLDQVWRKRWSQASEVGRLTLQSGECRVCIGFTNKWHATSKAFIQNKPKAIEVSTTVKWLAAHLLWRKVFRSAHHDVVTGEIITT